VTLLPTEAPARALSTELPPGSVVEERRLLGAAKLWEHLPTAAVLAAVAWWLVFAAHNWGGRGPHAVSIGAVFTLLAVLATRPDRRLGHTPLVLAAVTSAGAFVVAATSLAGWQGATVGATYACVAWLTVAVAAEVRRRPRTALLVAGLILVATLEEFAGGWTAWHGGMDPRVAMSGTFYWHNPFAIFMLPGAVIGAAFWLGNRGPIAAIGLLSAVLASTAIVYSTSRATLACLVLGLVIMVALHMLLAGSVRMALRSAVGGVVVAAAAYVVGGPPFFPHRFGLFAGLTGRAAEQQSLGQNGGYRLDFWREAITVFTHHPLVGSGFRALASVANPLVPRAWPRSPLAHNGYLQALSEGGLVLGVPVCVAAALLLWRLLRQLRDAIGRAEAMPVTLAVPVALAALLAHSVVDFDWSYAALFAMTGVLGGIVLGRSTTRTAAATPQPQLDPPAGHDRGKLALLAVGVVTLIVAAYTARTGQIQLNVALHVVSGHGGLG
jgi:O-antigen ligase